MIPTQSKIINNKEYYECYDCCEFFPIDDTICCQGETEAQADDGTLLYVSQDHRTRCFDCHEDYDLSIQHELINNYENDTGKYFKRMYELECKADIEFISYGLAPNPVGYCYEKLNMDKAFYDRKDIKKLLKEADTYCHTAPSGYLQWSGL